MKKNRCLNFFKGIACFGVISAHIKFPGYFGEGLINLFHWTVPYFLMISGYYSFYQDRNVFYKKIPKKVKHILEITIISILIYFIFIFLNHLLIERDILEWFKNIFSLKTLFDVIVVTNFSPTIKASHLWYLPSLIYCYLVLYIAVKYSKVKLCYSTIPILTILRILVSYLPGFNWHCQQNFLLGAFPYFMIGYYIADNKEKIDQITDKLGNNKLLLIIIIGELLRLSATFIKTAVDIFEIGAIIAAVSIFIFALKNPELYISKFFEIIGHKYSLFIYIMHVLIGIIANTFFELISLNNYEFYPYFLSVLVPIATLIAAIVWDKIVNWLKSDNTKLIKVQ